MVASVPVLNLPLGGAEDSTLLANFLASFAALTAATQASSQMGQQNTNDSPAARKLLNFSDAAGSRARWSLRANE
jgi:hypothetical protein